MEELDSDVVLLVAVDVVGVVALDDVDEDDGGLESSRIHLVFLFLGILKLNEVVVLKYDFLKLY